MSNSLSRALDAHGGLVRWRELATVRAHLVNGGALWSLKGQAGVIDDVYVRVDLHEQFASHAPFGAPGLRTAFRGEYVAIEDEDRNIVEERQNSRQSFAGHTLETPWDRLQLAYFTGYAMRTYLTAPFAFVSPGFMVEETGPWKENGETWERLKVTYPSDFTTHGRQQVFYFGGDGLLRRHDYTAEVVNGGPAAHYVHGYEKVDGIMVPTRRRVYGINADGSVATDLLLVSIDLDEISFE
jgi:hypothetical protein